MHMHRDRKSPRMKGYDYSTPTAYFITICTHKKQCIFGKPDILNQYGQIAHYTVLELPSLFPCISVDHFVVMPNHVHMLLTINAGQAELLDHTPNLSTIVGTYKSRVSRLIHQSDSKINVWQRSYHDMCRETKNPGKQSGNTSMKIHTTGKTMLCLCDRNDWQPCRGGAIPRPPAAKSFY